MSIRAEFHDHCDYCDEPIEVGHEIANTDEWGWVHADCARSIAGEEE